MKYFCKYSRFDWIKIWCKVNSTYTTYKRRKNINKQYFSSPTAIKKKCQEYFNIIIVLLMSYSITNSIKYSRHATAILTTTSPHHHIWYYFLTFFLFLSFFLLFPKEKDWKGKNMANVIFFFLCCIKECVWEPWRKVYRQENDVVNITKQKSQLRKFMFEEMNINFFG